MIEVKEVSVSYEGVCVVEPTSFTVKAGEWWMIAGPNGAGKSSLVKAIAQLLPYAGTVLWQGEDARDFPTREWAKRVGVVSQMHGMEYGFTVEEVVEMGRYAHQKGALGGQDQKAGPILESALRATGLLELRERNVLTLSGGQWQRTVLARVFAQDPAVLLLDEPANHLDLSYQKQLFDLIQDWLSKGERAVVSVVHDVSLAKKYGTHALLLEEAQTIAQGPAEAVLTKENLEKAYHMDIYAWMQSLLDQWL